MLPPGVTVRFHQVVAEVPELSSHHQRIYVIPVATAALPAVIGLPQTGYAPAHGPVSPPMLIRSGFAHQ